MNTVLDYQQYREFLKDYYEDQKRQAKARSQAFLNHRAPKFMSYFNCIIEANPTRSGHLVGSALSYIDLAIFQLAEGLAYAFPRAMQNFDRDYPQVARLRDSIRRRPNIDAYLNSKRRLAFNESGIFRHYPELDQDPA